MTEDGRERLRILTIAAEDAYERLQGLRMMNTYPMTHLEKIAHSTAIYEAEIDYSRAMGKVRAYQHVLASKP